jgi:hypothetical protein
MQQSHLLPHGYSVIIRQPVPKMQLAYSVPVTPEFRAEVNQWMIEFFGYIPFPPEEHNRVVMSHTNKTIVMTAQAWDTFKKAVRESERYAGWVP